MKSLRWLSLLTLLAPLASMGADSAYRTQPEARALWVTRFDYDSEAKITRIMDVAARAHFNIIYFQARAAGDAYYRSKMEPCAALLCGKIGGTPTYDPLEVAVREGHLRGLQVHAYLNALTARAAGIEGQCRAIPEPDLGNPRHVLLDHPEWVMRDRTGKFLPCPNSEEYVWLSPAFPEVRHRLAAVAADVARRYDVDGIHLDRIRFPGEDWSYDPAAKAEFELNPDTHPSEWKAYRTGLVSRMVRETYDSIQLVKPRLVLSAAVWGVYNDKWAWHTLAGATNLMQDSRGWARGGYMDVLVPMTYYRIGPAYCSRIDWRCTLDEQMQGARSKGVTGIAVFSFKDADEAEIWGPLAQDLFAERAAVPDMPWKQSGTH